MMISSLQMLEVTKYKHEFTVEVAEALSMVFVLSPIVRLSVCGQVFNSAYLKFVYGWIQNIPSFFYSLLWPPRYLPNSASLKNMGVSVWVRCLAALVPAITEQVTAAIIIVVP